MAQSETIPRDTIENRVEEWMAEAECPGIGIAVVDDGETVLATGYGQRKIDPPAPATENTLFGIGSATKPVTATAVLALIERGDLALDDTVSEHVPYFEDIPGDPITVADLLSHTGGMPADDTATLVVLDEVFDVDVGPSVDGWNDFRDHVSGSMDRRLVGRRFDADEFMYYNSGYIVLSRLVEEVTSKQFGDYVRHAVFDRVGMNTATFDTDAVGRPSDESHQDVMTPYQRGEDDEFVATTLPESPTFAAPGGLLASVSDLAAFLSGHITGDLPLSDDLRQSMYDAIGTHKRLVDGTTYDYGYGFELRPFANDVLVGHSGDAAVSSGYLGFLRDRGLGVAIGTNARPEQSPERLAVEVLSICTGQEPAQVIPERAIERQVDPIEGKYEAYPGVQSATVEWTGDALSISHETPLGGQKLELQPTSLDPAERCFRTVAGDGEVVTAKFSVTGKQTELLLDRLLFRRVGPLATGEDGNHDS